MISNVIGILFMAIAHVFTWYQLEQKKINARNPKLYITLVCSVILLIIGVTFVDKFFKIASATVIFILLNYYLMKNEIKKTILLPFVTQLMIMVSEMILMIILSILGCDIPSIIQNPYGDFMVNMVVALFVILMNFSSIFKRLYQFILKETDKISSEYFIAFSFIVILIANILSMTVYYKIDFKYLLLFNTLITIIYFIIIIHSFSNKNNYLKMSAKYNTTLSSLREYEDILNKYRVSNHENKNQLLMIRNMVKNQEKNIPEYIDTLVENKMEDNEKLLGQSMIIPEGGLRGLVYSKMLIMNEYEIDFDLSIDKAIRSVELIQLGEQNVLDICKIIGVFLDNAIEEVNALDDKFVDLEMTLEGKYLYFSVTNNFKGTIDVNLIKEKGYSTKGEGHGYGLSLVQEILLKNRLLKNETIVSNDEFTQRLRVNIGKIKY